MKCFMKALAGFFVLTAAFAALAWFGGYNFAADVPHWGITERTIHVLRERSVEARAASIKPPVLTDAALIEKGAGQYAEMCVSCHLAPGIAQTEMRQGLYPVPPDLTKEKIDAREAFWVIKHGIKMTAMPAWGTTHDDATIWSMVAFLQNLPGRPQQQYEAMVSRAAPHEDMGGAGSGGEAAHGGHNHSH